MYMHSSDNLFSHRLLQKHHSSGRFRLGHGRVYREGALGREGNCGDEFDLSNRLRFSI